MTIDDFERHQIDANKLGIQGFAIPFGQREKYRSLGEGRRVRLTGFIVGVPHARRTDSANCKLVGRANNSFRIHIAQLADDTEFDSIIAQMIPQKRHPKWTLDKLRRIAAQKRPVTVTGALFYDSKHVVNSDPDDEQPGHPKRLSLWEIHPVTEFLVCNREVDFEECQNTFDPKHWTPLEEFGNRDQAR